MITGIRSEDHQGSTNVGELQTAKVINNYYGWHKEDRASENTSLPTSNWGSNSKFMTLEELLDKRVDKDEFCLHALGLWRHGWLLEAKKIYEYMEKFDQTTGGKSVGEDERYKYRLGLAAMGLSEGKIRRTLEVIEQILSDTSKVTTLLAELKIDPNFLQEKVHSLLQVSSNLPLNWPGHLLKYYHAALFTKIQTDDELELSRVFNILFYCAYMCFDNEKASYFNKLGTQAAGSRLSTYTLLFKYHNHMLLSDSLLLDFGILLAKKSRDLEDAEIAFYREIEKIEQALEQQGWETESEAYYREIYKQNFKANGCIVKALVLLEQAEIDGGVEFYQSARTLYDEATKLRKDALEKLQELQKKGNKHRPGVLITPYENEITKLQFNLAKDIVDVGLDIFRYETSKTQDEKSLEIELDRAKIHFEAASSGMKRTKIKPPYYEVMEFYAVLAKLAYPMRPLVPSLSHEEQKREVRKSDRYPYRNRFSREDLLGCCKQLVRILEPGNDTKKETAFIQVYSDNQIFARHVIRHYIDSNKNEYSLFLTFEGGVDRGVFTGASYSALESQVCSHFIELNKKSSFDASKIPIMDLKNFILQQNKRCLLVFEISPKNIGDLKKFVAPQSNVDVIFLLSSGVTLLPRAGSNCIQFNMPAQRRTLVDENLGLENGLWSRVNQFNSQTGSEDVIFALIREANVLSLSSGWEQLKKENKFREAVEKILGFDLLHKYNFLKPKSEINCIDYALLLSTWCEMNNAESLVVNNEKMLFLSHNTVLVERAVLLLKKQEGGATIYLDWSKDIALARMFIFLGHAHLHNGTYPMARFYIWEIITQLENSRPTIREMVRSHFVEVKLRQAEKALASVYYAEGLHVNALAIANKLTAKIPQHMPDSCLDDAINLGTRGLAFKSLGRFREAMQDHHRALEIKRNLQNEGLEFVPPLELAITQFNIIQTKFCQSEALSEEDETELRQVQSVFERDLSFDSARNISMHLLWAKIYFQKHDVHRAKDHCEQALNRCGDPKENYKEQNPKSVLLHYILGDIYMSNIEMLNIKEAQNNFERAVRVGKHHYNDRLPEIFAYEITYPSKSREIEKLCQENNTEDEKMALIGAFVQAHRITERLFGEAHALTAWRYYELGLVYKSYSQEEEYQYAFKSAMEILCKLQTSKRLQMRLEPLYRWVSKELPDYNRVNNTLETETQSLADLFPQIFKVNTQDKKALAIFLERFSLFDEETLGRFNNLYIYRKCLQTNSLSNLVRVFTVLGHFYQDYEGKPKKAVIYRKKVLALLGEQLHQLAEQLYRIDSNQQSLGMRSDGRRLEDQLKDIKEARVRAFKRLGESEHSSAVYSKNIVKGYVRAYSSFQCALWQLKEIDLETPAIMGLHAGVLSKLGKACLNMGEHQCAQRYFNEALIVYERLIKRANDLGQHVSEFKLGQANTRRRLARVYLALNEYEKARNLLCDALSHFKAPGVYLGPPAELEIHMALTYRDKAVANFYLGLIEEALYCNQKAHSLFYSHSQINKSLVLQMAKVRANESNCLYMQNNFVGARRLLEEAISISPSDTAQLRNAIHKARLARILCAQGEHPFALEKAREALLLYPKHDKLLRQTDFEKDDFLNKDLFYWHERSVTALIVMSDVYEAKRNLERAKKYLLKAVDILKYYHPQQSSFENMMRYRFNGGRSSWPMSKAYTSQDFLRCYEKLLELNENIFGKDHARCDMYCYRILQWNESKDANDKYKRNFFIDEAYPNKENENKFFIERIRPGCSHNEIRMRLTRLRDSIQKTCQGVRNLPRTALLIIGPSGAGKTILGWQFAHDKNSKNYYEDIFWIDGSNLVNASFSLRRIAKHMKQVHMASSMSDAAIFTEVIQAWATYPRSLIIVDNFKVKKLLEEGYLQKLSEQHDLILIDGGEKIFPLQSREMEYWKPVELSLSDRYTEQELDRYCDLRLPGKSQAFILNFREIAAALDYHPLALGQVIASVVVNKDRTDDELIDKYLMRLLYLKEVHKSQNDTRKGPYPADITTSLALDEVITKYNKELIQPHNLQSLMYACALLAGDRIDRRYLIDSSGIQQKEAEEIIDLLDKYRLINQLGNQVPHKKRIFIVMHQSVARKVSRLLLDRKPAGLVRVLERLANKTTEDLNNLIVRLKNQDMPDTTPSLIPKEELKPLALAASAVQAIKNGLEQLKDSNTNKLSNQYLNVQKFSFQLLQATAWYYLYRLNDREGARAYLEPIEQLKVLSTHDNFLWYVTLKFKLLEARAEFLNYDVISAEKAKNHLEDIERMLEEKTTKYDELAHEFEHPSASNLKRTSILFQVRKELAWAYRVYGDHDKALENTNDSLLLSDIAYAKGDYERAESLLSNSLPESGFHIGRRFYQLGKIYYRKGNYKQAGKSFHDAISQWRKVFDVPAPRQSTEVTLEGILNGEQNPKLFILDLHYYNHPEMAQALRGIGDVLTRLAVQKKEELTWMMGYLNVAEECYSGAKKLLTYRYQMNSAPEIGLATRGLGHVAFYRAKLNDSPEQYKEALQFYQNSVMDLLKPFAVDEFFKMQELFREPGIAISLRCFAETRLEMARAKFVEDVQRLELLQEAQELCEYAFHLQSCQFPTLSHPYQAYTAYVLSKISYDLHTMYPVREHDNSFNKAWIYANHAKIIYERTFANELSHPDCITLKNHMGDMEKKSGKVNRGSIDEIIKKFRLERGEKILRIWWENTTRARGANTGTVQPIINSWASIGVTTNLSSGLQISSTKSGFVNRSAL